MKDDPERGPVAAPARTRRRRLRPYVDAWLLALFVSSSLGVLLSLSEEAARSGARPLSAFVAAPFVALLTAPALWLLRLFPDAAENGWLRCCRRIAIGIPCGLFPAALLAALIVKADDPGSHAGAGALWISGLLHGGLVGLVDSMHGDAERAAARDDRDA